MLAFHFENLQHFVTSFTRSCFFFLGCQAAGIPSWAFQFAHFIPSQRPDGWGCSNGPELDVAPPSRGAYTTLSQTESWSCYCFEKLQQRQNLHNHLGDQGSFLQFMVMMQLGAFFFELNQIDSTRIILIHHFTQALHYWQMSAVSVSVCEKLTEVKFVFGNEVGPDGLGPPNNRTVCTFSPGERMLSEKIRYLETSLVWEKNPCLWHFCISMIPIFVSTCKHFSIFSLSLSPDRFFPKKKQCIQKGARWASFAASGEPFAWPQYLGKATVAPTLASRRRWVEPPPDVHRRSPIPNLPL